MHFANISTSPEIATNGELHPLRKAFICHDAFQCGYCTPGQICSAVGLIAEGHAKTADEIRELMSGNICRAVHPSDMVAMPNPCAFSSTAEFGTFLNRS
jgi:xanthine dehydrogenase YagT iron-sulfur-binding subunit